MSPSRLNIFLNIFLEVGTRLYIAPEVQSRRRLRGPRDHSKADMYSLGVCRSSFLDQIELIYLFVDRILRDELQVLHWF